MIYTRDTIRSYVRSLEDRLEDTSAFPNTWADSCIQDGFTLANNTRPIFITSETFDIEDDVVTDGLTEVELIVTEEVHSVMEVEYDTTVFSSEITGNNHVLITVENANITPLDYIVTVTYYYYPATTWTEIELSMEMYDFVKEGIAVKVFEYLKEHNNTDLHRTKMLGMAVTGTLVPLRGDTLDADDERMEDNGWV